MSDIKPQKTLFINVRGNGDRNVASWSKIQGAGPRPGPCGVQFVRLLKEGEKPFKGETAFYDKMQELGECLGEYHGIALYDQQQIIAPDRKGKILVFPDTMRINPKGEICVLVLTNQAGKWTVQWRPIKREWTGQYRVAKEADLSGKTEVQPAAAE